MISVEDALKIIQETAVEPRVERVALERALHRILARDVVSKIYMPPFHKSAMDGYALNSRDVSDRFQVMEMIPAGSVPLKSIRKGQCAKIMTGGMVPRGADRVVRRELTVEENGFMRVTGMDDSLNICYRGEDVKPGDAVLRKGAVVRPQEIGILASLGTAEVAVSERVTVGVIATGTEIVAPGRSLKPGRIYDSNSYSLAAQITQCGAIVRSNRWSTDSIKDIRRAVESSLERCRMVLVSGGVSAGDLDYVPGILHSLGVDLRFEKIAVQPGKPTVFGTRRGRIIFGVPGNPVSTFVIFEVFVKPLLYRMMGHDYRPLTVQGVMKKSFIRKKTDRAAFVPVRVRDGMIERLDYHGSAHIQALSGANGLLYIPKGKTGYPERSRVNVRLL